MDMVMAGGDTSISVMSFAIMFLCLRKELQDKAYQEILENVGPDRIISAEDRLK